MPGRYKSLAWEHVSLFGRKAQCNYCKNPVSARPHRIEHHLESCLKYRMFQQTDSTQFDERADDHVVLDHQRVPQDDQAQTLVNCEGDGTLTVTKAKDVLFAKTHSLKFDEQADDHVVLDHQRVPQDDQTQTLVNCGGDRTLTVTKAKDVLFVKTHSLKFDERADDHVVLDHQRVPQDDQTQSLVNCEGDGTLTVTKFKDALSDQTQDQMQVFKASKVKSAVTIKSIKPRDNSLNAEECHVCGGEPEVKCIDCRALFCLGCGALFHLNKSRSQHKRQNASKAVTIISDISLPPTTVVSDNFTSQTFITETTTDQGSTSLVQPIIFDFDHSYSDITVSKQISSNAADQLNNSVQPTIRNLNRSRSDSDIFAMGESSSNAVNSVADDQLNRSASEPMLAKIIMVRSDLDFTIPDYIWKKLYNVETGCINRDAYTYYKNEIGDHLDKKFKCLILLNDIRFKKHTLIIYAHCKHEGCRSYSLECPKEQLINGTFMVNHNDMEQHHKQYLTRQLRGSMRVDAQDVLEDTMPLTHFRAAVGNADPSLLENHNADTVKSMAVFKKARSEKLRLQDLATDDFNDMVSLQDITKRSGNDYIKRVISPFGVYVYSDEQMKALHMLHVEKRKTGKPIIGHTDATGNVASVNVCGIKKILYYACMIRMKSDEDNKTFIGFPFTECLNSEHDATAIGNWKFNFKEAYAKVYPSDTPILDIMVTDFSYANLHAILHAFNGILIQEYLDEVYKYVVGINDDRILQRYVKPHLCATHHMSTFAENSIKFFKRENKTPSDTEKVVLETLGTMMAIRNYNLIKEIWYNLAILLKNEFINDSVTKALTDLAMLCTTKIDTSTYKFKFDALICGDINMDLEEFDEKQTMFDVPIYKSSKFFMDANNIYDSIKTWHDTTKVPVANPYYNHSFAMQIMKRFMGILPLWTGLIYPDSLEIERVNNQPLESHINIIKNLLEEKAASIGKKHIKPSRVVKLLREMTLDNFKTIHYKLPTGRLNHGKLAIKNTKSIGLRKSGEQRNGGGKKPIGNKRNVAVDDHESIDEENVGQQKSVSKRIVGERKLVANKRNVAVDDHESIDENDVCARKSVGKRKPIGQRKSVGQRKSFSQSKEDKAASFQYAKESWGKTNYRKKRGENSYFRQKTLKSICEKKRNINFMLLEKYPNHLINLPGYYLTSFDFVVARIGEKFLSRQNFSSITQGNDVSNFAMDYIMAFTLKREFANMTLHSETLVENFDNNLIRFNLTNKKYLVIPHCAKDHWILFIADIEQKKFGYINSADDISDYNMKIYFKNFLTFVKKYNLKYTTNRLPTEWTFSALTNSFDKQTETETHECGIYVIHYVQQFIANPEIEEIGFDPIQKRILLVNEMLEMSDDMYDYCLKCGKEDSDEGAGRLVDDWIQCCNCKRWLHSQCIKITLKDYNNREFKCFLCEYYDNESRDDECHDIEVLGVDTEDIEDEEDVMDNSGDIYDE